MPHTFTRVATPVSLRQLFSSASFVGCGDIAVESVSEDSRTCEQGCLFVAIPGTTEQGTTYVDDAVANGATAILTQTPLENIRVKQCIVPDVRRAYAHLCEALFGYPSRRLGLVGVTGTNGKTTVTWLVRSILEAAGWPTAVIGTIEYNDGMEAEPATLTTPSAKVLSQWLSTAVARATQYAAIELSSHALDQSRAAGTLLDVAIITNITQDHFDYHGDVATYRASKARIFEQIKGRGLIVLNADDPLTASLLGETPPGTQVLTYGLDQSADLMAGDLRLTPHGTTFRLQTMTQSVDVTTHLIGRHNVSNCLAAAAAAMHVGVPLTEIAEGIEALDIVPGRMELVDEHSPVNVYVDYAHTDDALSHAIAAAREVTSGRVLCVFGAGGNRDQSKRSLLGRAAGAADIAVVTSDNPRNEHPQHIIDAILTGCREMPVTLHVESDRAEAIRWAIAEAEPGDTVLVAGKGHETVQIIGDERHPFDDRAICREAIAEITSTVPVGSH
ncbi:MAG: UDP-N-acetylmuramoyl-L-alanyl-D-glutamate--2,6-diaminopimelate ligase [Planctomycetaceae bacterium]|nr:UDP-N-acetylmuramoyl-L-alanyl-D-glutamate--2,6-diaminopimelate ligase [Planctomycetaceae bacterium]